MKSRAFNKVELDSGRGVVRKSSKDVGKIKAEILFYLNCPEPARSLLPKLLDYAKDFSWYEIEYIENKTVTERLADSEFSTEEWAALFSSIKIALDKFPADGNQTSFIFLYTIFIEKALKRAKTLGNGELHKIFFEGCTLNGVKRRPLAKLLIVNSGVLFKVPLSTAVIHGDLCFSNMLINSDLTSLNLIDPRGGFDGPSIYGPIVYDIAKIAQSVYSWYDKIIEGSYNLSRSEGGYTLDLLGSDWSKVVAKNFEGILNECEISEESAILLAGLLLAGTPALHIEDLDRATALALNAVLLLSD